MLFSGWVTMDEQLPPPAYEDVVATAPPLRPQYFRQGSSSEEANKRLVDDISCLKDSTFSHLPRLKKMTSDLDTSYSRLKAHRARLDRELYDWKTTLLQMIDQSYKERVTQLGDLFETLEHKIIINRDKVFQTYNSARKVCGTATELADSRNQYSLQMLKRRLENKIVEMEELIPDDLMPEDNFTTWRLEKPHIGVGEISILVGMLEKGSSPEGSRKRLEESDQTVPESPPEATYSHVEDGTEDGAVGTTDTSRTRVTTEEASAPPIVEEPPTPIKYNLQHKFQTKTYKDKARCHPFSFAVDFDGNVIVPDKFNQKLKIFTERGQLIRELIHPQMRSPMYVALTLSGDIAVSDVDGGDIKFFSTSGVLLGSVPINGTPGGISFNLLGDLVTVDTCSKSLIVADPTIAKVKSTIRQYTVDVPVHAYTSDWRSTTVMQQRNFNYFQQPHYVAVDHNDNIFVSDRAANTIQMFDKHGQFGWRAGQGGSGKGDLNSPYGVTVSSDDAIIVADYNNHRIQKMNLDRGQFFDPILTGEDGIRFPTCVTYTADDRLMVAEYLTGEIKVFSRDDHKEEEEILPPAYGEAIGDRPAGRLTAELNDMEGGVTSAESEGRDYPYIPGETRVGEPQAPAWETTI